MGLARVIDFNCQYCGKLLRLEDSFAGCDGWCRACKRMIIVPDGGPVVQIEDLPAEQAVARLQKLLQYAATKADEYKILRVRKGKEEKRKANMEATASDALGEQLIRYTALRADFEAAEKARHQAEARQEELESALRLADGADTESVKEEIAVLEAKLAAERATRDSLEQRANSQDDELQELRDAQERHQDAEQAALDRSTNLESDLESVREECENLKSELTAVQLSLKSIEGERDRLQESGDSAREAYKKLESELASVRLSLKDTESERDRLQESGDSIREKHEHLESELAAVRLSLKDTEGARDGLQKSGDSAREAYEKLESELASVRLRLKDIEEERDRVQVFGDSAREQYENLESELASVQLRLKETEEERNRLNSSLEEMSSNGQAVTHVLQKKEKEIVGLREELSLRKSEGDSEAPHPDERIQTLEAQCAQSIETETGMPTPPEQEEEHCAAKQPSSKLATELGEVSSHDFQVVGDATQLKAMQNIEIEDFVDRWHREAEVEGAKKAQFRLVVRYEKGLAVAQDDAQAFRWLSKAADQEHVGAQYHLGRMYAEGRGVAQDSSMALDWLQKASEQGETGAQFELGLMYLNGTGVIQDNAKALAWFHKAAEQDNPGALYHLGILYAEGSDASLDLDLALDSFRRAAELGHADAQYHLGQKLLDGTGVAQDECLALEWFRKAAEEGHAQAQYALGTCLEQGRGAVQNYVRAHAWYSLAAVRLDQARSARDQLATSLQAEQLLQSQKFAEEMHTETQTDNVVAT
ncbi:MAG: hypothetical protein L3K26_01815 [Candidatus Hydrogenedentes bacterium]|nr:hypothetical protein [Candidatus Hydrogenedentota bacterium]